VGALNLVSLSGSTIQRESGEFWGETHRFLYLRNDIWIISDKLLASSWQ
jgi:hypothetical protein